jgi:predicted small secreted protein
MTISVQGDRIVVLHSKEVSMRTQARLWLAVAVLAVAAPLLAACNTVRGMGEDMSAAGRGITHTAERIGGDK